MHRAGQGNPLFLVELLEALQRSDDIDALPDSVEGLIQARIDTLIPLDRDLLQHLSVLGVGFQSDRSHVRHKRQESTGGKGWSNTYTSMAS